MKMKIDGSLSRYSLAKRAADIERSINERGAIKSEMENPR